MALDHRTRSLDDEGHRKNVHPTEVKGFWNRKREKLQFFLILFFLAIPWIKISGKPLLLLDIFERKFSIFGVLFRAHDVPLFFLFLISFILVFGFLTALFGRVWCGWACPQTVFIEAVFRRIERWVEGVAIERRQKEKQPFTFELFLEKALKWFLFLLVSLVITHSFLAIFVGTEQLRQMIAQGPIASPQAFLFIVLSTAVILFDFGWFREQFCIVMCPYGRIQSVFQDTKTKTVAYDYKRDDCVKCLRCVQVCPTSIDIRNGSSQLECIACTACIDACDDVMARLKKPLGLIRYASVNEINEKRKETIHQFWLRGRSLVYGGLLLVVISAIVIIAQRRSIAMVEIFKNRGAPYIVTEEGITNLFVIEIASRSDQLTQLHFIAPEDKTIELIMPNNPIEIKSGDYLRQPFTVRFQKTQLINGKKSIFIKINVQAHKSEVLEKEVTLVGPF